MTAMVPDVPRDGFDLDDMLVSYWDGDTFVVQNGCGELLIASDTVVEVER